MKILLVCEFFPIGKDLRFSGGVEARSFYIAKYLAKKHQIFVITSRLTGSKEAEKMFGFTVYRVGPTRKYTATVGDLFSRLMFIKDAINIGKKLDIDIIDGSNYISHFIAKQISLYRKIPVVAWYPDVWLNNWIKNAGLYGILGELLERINLRREADSYIVISKETGSKLKQFTKKRVNIIPCGIDSQEFINNVKKNQIDTIICISRLAKYKDIKTLIFAFAHISTKINNLRLIIVGTGPEYNKLTNLVNSLRIKNRVKFLSNLPRKELISILKSSKIFCLPSKVEGFAIVTIEAVAAGIPYVVSNINVFKEVTKNGKGGLLFNVDDIKDLSNKLEKLLQDKKLYRNKQQEGVLLAKNYQWQDIAAKTEKLYKELLQK